MPPHSYMWPHSQKSPGAQTLLCASHVSPRTRSSRRLPRGGGGGGEGGGHGGSGAGGGDGGDGGGEVVTCAGSSHTRRVSGIGLQPVSLAESATHQPISSSSPSQGRHSQYEAPANSAVPPSSLAPRRHSDHEPPLQRKSVPRCGFASARRYTGKPAWSFSPATYAISFPPRRSRSREQQPCCSLRLPCRRSTSRRDTLCAASMGPSLLIISVVCGVGFSEPTRLATEPPRLPQSSGSEPSGHTEVAAPGPPSSQVPLIAKDSTSLQPLATSAASTTGSKRRTAISLQGIRMLCMQDEPTS